LTNNVTELLSKTDTVTDDENRICLELIRAIINSASSNLPPKQNNKLCNIRKNDEKLNLIYNKLNTAYKSTTSNEEIIKDKNKKHI